MSVPDRAGALGVLRRSTPHPLTIISPHLDDAVLSCAQVLASHPGSTVVTVFAGRPPDGRLSSWDEKSFQPGDDPMTIRQDEDRAALNTLSARAVHLSYLDAGYGTPPLREDMVHDLARCVDAIAPRTVLFPLGIVHADHVRTHEASLQLLRERPHIRWVIYEELPYRFEDYEAVSRQKVALQAQGFRLAELRLPSNARKRVKLRAVRCYKSQMKPLSWQRIVRSLLAEQYWRISGV